MTQAGRAASRWRPQHGLATALTVLLVFHAALTLLCIGALFNRIDVANDIDNLDFTTNLVQRSDDADSLVAASVVILSLVLLATGVVFIAWLYRAAKNNETLGREQPRFGAGWAIGSWFIPLASFVIPVLIVQDLWRGADPDRPRGDPAWRESPRSALVAWWWGAWVLAWVASQALLLDADTVDEVRTQDTVAIIGMVLTAGAAILAVAVVRALTRRQDACLAAQQQASGEVT
jgi:uncharacterized protein DUF4328